MAKPIVTSKSRAVFSDAARDRFSTSDLPIMAVDDDTGVTLTYRFEPHAGGMLRLTGGPIGAQVIVVGCEEPDLNLVATLLIDGLKARQP